MPPTSFSITQQHPALGSDNTISHSNNGDNLPGSSHSHQTISFHSNTFPSSDNTGKGSSSSAEPSYLNHNSNNDDDGESNSDDQGIGSALTGYGEGRILSTGKGSFYGKKLFEVAPSSVNIFFFL